MNKWTTEEVERATGALVAIFDSLEEIDPREFTEKDRERIGKLAGLCAEFGVHFNAA